MRLNTVTVLGVASCFVALCGCDNSQPEPFVMPLDGVHITGPVNIVYPFADGGTCDFYKVPGVTTLLFNVESGPGQTTVAMVIAPFTGPGAVGVRWPAGVGQSSLTFGLNGGRTWHARSGTIAVGYVSGSTLSGTLRTGDGIEQNGTSKATAAGSWTCHVLGTGPGLESSPSPSPSPSTSPSPSPTVYPGLPPPPVGTPVTRQVLAPATVLPYAPLCSAPIREYQDGNAGPLFCLSGAIDVLAWRFFTQLNPLVMSLGRQVTLAQIQAAICADVGRGHVTIPEEDSAYSLAAGYYGWLNINGAPGHGFDPSAFVISGGCRLGSVTLQALWP
jgi:hypothetical protein